MEILEKLKQLEENILILEEIKNELSIEQIKEKKRFEWELRYGLFESIQIIIDISCKISSTYNLGNPKTYKECLELLSKFKYIEHELSKKLSSSVGLRNLLILEYTTIDIEKLFGFLNFLDEFKSFAKQIKIVID